MVVIMDDSFYTKYPVSNVEIFDMMSIGDYIFKEKGTLKRYLIKGSDTFGYYP